MHYKYCKWRDAIRCCRVTPNPLLWCHFSPFSSIPRCSPCSQTHGVLLVVMGYSPVPSLPCWGLCCLTPELWLCALSVCCVYEKGLCFSKVTLQACSLLVPGRLLSQQCRTWLWGSDQRSPGCFVSPRVMGWLPLERPTSPARACSADAGSDNTGWGHVNLPSSTCIEN